MNKSDKYLMKKLLSVRFKNSSTKRTHNSFPRFPIKWNTTKPGGSSHVSHASSSAAART